MNKQEFLAMSLPHGLKVLTSSRYALDGIAEISAVGTEQYQILGSGFQYGWYGDIYDCKPILHPLSDLTKEIEHKEMVLIPAVEMAKMRSSYLDKSRYETALGQLKMDITVRRLPFDMMQKLIEWHFDIAGLIEEGEAIDVNTLPENPYK